MIMQEPAGPTGGSINAAFDGQLIALRRAIVAVIGAMPRDQQDKVCEALVEQTSAPGAIKAELVTCIASEEAENHLRMTIQRILEAVRRS